MLRWFLYLYAVDNSFEKKCCASTLVRFEVRSRVALTTSTPVEAGSSSFEARVPGFVLSCFEGESGVVAAYEMKGVVGLAGG